jgi:hypothetical protein
MLNESGKCIPVYKTRLSVDSVPFDTINQDLDRAISTLPTGQYDLTVGHFASTVDFWERRDLEPWAESYRNKIQEIAKLLTPAIANRPYENYIKATWFNRNYPSGQVTNHNHKPCDMAIVWYLNVPSEGGNFILQFRDEEFVIPTTTGDMIVFPASLLHRTEVNNGNEPRIVMGANLSWTEDIKKMLTDKLSPSMLERQIEILYNKQQLELIETLSKDYT